MVFCDFRWKGENVATTEVTETLGLVDFIQEVNVYGVEIPSMYKRRLCSFASDKKVTKALKSYSVSRISLLLFAVKLVLFLVLQLCNSSLFKT